jgi:hypothetical protein
MQSYCIKQGRQLTVCVRFCCPQATQLMIMYHKYQQLLSRYHVDRLLGYDNSSGPNWATYEAAFLSGAPVIIGSAGWQAALPDAGRVQQGQRTVDVAQFCKTFAEFVCGLEGRVRNYLEGSRQLHMLCWYATC